VTISAATPQSCLLVRQAAAGATIPGKGIESGKWVVINSSKVSPSDCVHRPDGATKELSLAFGSLDRALYNLADMGKLFMGVAEGPPRISGSLPYLLFITPLSPLIEFLTLRISTPASLIEEPPYVSSKGL
jgi:hypothetical protein